MHTELPYDDDGDDDYDDDDYDDDGDDHGHGRGGEHADDVKGDNNDLLPPNTSKLTLSIVCHLIGSIVGVLEFEHTVIITR